MNNLLSLRSYLCPKIYLKSKILSCRNGPSPVEFRTDLRASGLLMSTKGFVAINITKISPYSLALKTKSYSKCYQGRLRASGSRSRSGECAVAYSHQINRITEA